MPRHNYFKDMYKSAVHEFRLQRQGHKFIQIQEIKDMNFQLAGVLKNIARVAKFVNSV